MLVIGDNDWTGLAARQLDWRDLGLKEFRRHGLAGALLRTPGKRILVLARDVAVVLSGLVGAAEIDVVEPRPIRLWIPLHQRLDRDGREIIGSHLRECAAVAADRRAHSIADEGFRHWLSLRCLTVGARR